MNTVLNIYKPVGVTPLEMIKELRRIRPEYKDLTISYAGRLDPLAHGVMLLLIGEENKNREQYLRLDKQYEFSVLFGVETDTYDYLGVVKDLTFKTMPDNADLKINEFLKKHTVTFYQPYPPFSSKPINGVPLYSLAKKGTLKESDLPTKEVSIYDFKLLTTQHQSSNAVQKTIEENIKKVSGDFRQEEILNRWREFFSIFLNEKFTLMHFSINCSSGTYVRSLAHQLGQNLGCGAIAFEIKRTKVDKYTITESIRLPL